MMSKVDSKLTVGASHSAKRDYTRQETDIPAQNPEMSKSLAGIAAQGAQLSKKISQITQWGQSSQYEESKLDPLADVVNSGNSYEGGLSSSPLLPPPATHTKNT